MIIRKELFPYGRSDAETAEATDKLVRGFPGFVPETATSGMGGHVTALPRDRYAQALGDLRADRVLGYDASSVSTMTLIRRWVGCGFLAARPRFSRVSTNGVT